MTNKLNNSEAEPQAPIFLNTEHAKFKSLEKVIPYYFRIQSEKKDKPKDGEKEKKDYTSTATCISYLEPRDIAQVLDDTFGHYNWQDEYYEVQGSVYCKIGIWSDIRKQWIWKSDAGETKRDYLKEIYLKATETDRYKLNQEMENVSKTQATDAFKRAAVKFGLGRFQYYMGTYKVKISGWNVVDNYGTIICYKNDNDALSEYLSKIAPMPDGLITEIKNCTTHNQLLDIHTRMYNLKDNENFLKILKKVKSKIVV